MQNFSFITYRLWTRTQYEYSSFPELDNFNIDLVWSLFFDTQDTAPQIDYNLEKKIVVISNCFLFQDKKFRNNLNYLNLTIANYRYILEVMNQVTIIQPTYIMWHLRRINDIDIVQALFKDTISDEDIKILEIEQKLCRLSE